MKYLTTLTITALVCSKAVAAPEQGTCDSPCDCHNAHSEGRWSVKTATAETQPSLRGKGVPLPPAGCGLTTDQALSLAAMASSFAFSAHISARSSALGNASSLV